MAKMYTSIDSYVQSVGSKYIDKGEFGGEGGRIGSDSAMRNYIAEQIQRLEDNGRDISGMQGFYDQVGARSVDGFANAGLFAETDKYIDDSPSCQVISIFFEPASFKRH